MRGYYWDPFRRQRILLEEALNEGYFYWFTGFGLKLLGFRVSTPYMHCHGPLLRVLKRHNP